MEFPTIITDIITKIIMTIRERYGITLDILNKLQPDDDYFLPLFEKDELSKIDIDMLEPRIIAFGDIHGDLQALVGILYAAELIDVNGDWIEERPTYVVQTGDIFDNYRPEIENSCLKEPGNLLDEFIILNYLTHLHGQAQQKENKSRIVLCIGNHELMNVFGHMKSYVIPETSLDAEYRQNLFKPGGVFATKLSCIFRVIAKIGNNLFMHGGIHQGNITLLNDILTYNNNLNEWLNGTKGVLLSPKIYEYNQQYLSITWFRKMTYTNEAEYIRFLQRLDAEHELKVIVGHTITSSEVVPSILIRASGRIILLDTAMSRCWSNKYNGGSCDLSNELYNISFIVIENDTITPKHKKSLLNKEILENNLKSTILTESNVNIIKTYNRIKKKRNYFSSHDYNLVIFKYEQNKYGIATININDDTLHKVYKTDKATKIIHEKGSMEVECTNIINVSNNSRSSFTIIFKNNNDITNFKLYFPTGANGGRKIRSRNNRNQNKITKQKRNKSIKNKKYYRISRRK
jgi:hypothetical protein